VPQNLPAARVAAPVFSGGDSSWFGIHAGLMLVGQGKRARSTGDWRSQRRLKSVLYQKALSV